MVMSTLFHQSLNASKTNHKQTVAGNSDLGKHLKEKKGSVALQGFVNGLAFNIFPSQCRGCGQKQEESLAAGTAV